MSNGDSKDDWKIKNIGRELADDVFNLNQGYIDLLHSFLNPAQIQPILLSR
jgi:hypothetical protein